MTPCRFLSLRLPLMAAAALVAGAAWNGGFTRVEIPSSADGDLQPAYFLAAQTDGPAPLLVSLHTWSADYTQEDPLANMAAAAGWNYIRPNFRGPNWTPDACLSDKAVSDIDDAIAYALDHGRVDLDNIFVVGASGGGYAALGAYLRTPFPVKAFVAWVPISDLTAWYYQSKHRDTRYAEDILNCTSDGHMFDEAAARERSPLFWELPESPNGRLEIYAGIDDGYTGSVPISHSIRFYNRVVEHYGQTEQTVGEGDMIKLLTRGVERDDGLGHIGDRAVLYRRDTDAVSLVIFDGGHEMLAEFCFDRLRRMAEPHDS